MSNIFPFGGVFLKGVFLTYSFVVSRHILYSTADEGTGIPKSYRTNIKLYKLLVLIMSLFLTILEHVPEQ